MFKRIFAATTLLFATSCATLSAYEKEKEELCSTKPVSIEEEHFIEQLSRMNHLEAIVSITTDKQTERYLTEYLSYEYDKNNYFTDEYMAGFSEIHAHKKDDCDGGAVAAIALLSDNFYKMYLLKLYKKYPLDSNHFLCIYQAPDGTYGSLSINWVENATGRYRTDLNTLLTKIDVWTQHKYKSYTLIDATPYKDRFTHGKGNHYNFINTLFKTAEQHPLPSHPNSQ